MENRSIASATTFVEAQCWDYFTVSLFMMNAPDMHGFGWLQRHVVVMKVNE